jgi:hypothetical protein
VSSKAVIKKGESDLVDLALEEYEEGQGEDDNIEKVDIATEVLVPLESRHENACAVEEHIIATMIADWNNLHEGKFIDF